MKILIETYRGAAIEFDNEREVFSCFLFDYGKESKSFAAVKKAVDEYLKDNNEFKPFWIITRPESYKSGIKIKITGIRKDNRFVGEFEDGKKAHISDYEEKEYYIYTPETHDPLYAKVAYLETLVDEARATVKAAQKLITGTPLNAVKANYIV